MPMNMPVKATTGRLRTPTWYSTGKNVSRFGSRLNSHAKVRQEKRAKSPAAWTLSMATPPQSVIHSWNAPGDVRADSSGCEP